MTSKMTKTKLFLLISFLGIVVAIFWPREPQFNSEAVWGARVLVTGASSGIGEQLAYQYARHGASVFITARREQLLAKVVETCKELGSPGAQFGYLPADMSNMTQTTPVIQAAVDTLGGLDQVVLNHGYIQFSRLFTNTQESFSLLKKSLDVNMRSFAHLAIEALPHLKKTRGRLTVVSSITGKLALPLFSCYSASKFALDGFFAAFRHEVMRFNVSVSVAVLGGIATEKLDDIIADIHQTYKSTTSDQQNTRWAGGRPDACAYEIMRGATMREREIYFPSSQYIKYIVMFRELIVRLGDITGDMGLNELLKDTV